MCLGRHTAGCATLNPTRRSHAGPSTSRTRRGAHPTERKRQETCEESLAIVGCADVHATNAHTMSPVRATIPLAAPIETV